MIFYTNLKFRKLSISQEFLLKMAVFGSKVRKIENPETYIPPDSINTITGEGWFENIGFRKEKLKNLGILEEERYSCHWRYFSLRGIVHQNSAKNFFLRHTAISPLHHLFSFCIPSKFFFDSHSAPRF